jgi:hypothetical protein
MHRRGVDPSIFSAAGEKKREFSRTPHQQAGNSCVFFGDQKMQASRPRTAGSLSRLYRLDEVNDLRTSLFATRPAASRPTAGDERGRSCAEAVYLQLRDDIFELRLLPGERLTAGTIAERFGVSRTPAREALHRLQSDGLMQGHVRGGSEVVPIDFKRFDDLYEMRKLIETFAVRKLCVSPLGEGVRYLLGTRRDSRRHPQRRLSYGIGSYRGAYSRQPGRSAQADTAPLA